MLYKQNKTLPWRTRFANGLQTFTAWTRAVEKVGDRAAVSVVHKEITYIYILYAHMYRGVCVCICAAWKCSNFLSMLVSFSLMVSGLKHLLL